MYTRSHVKMVNTVVGYIYRFWSSSETMESHLKVDSVGVAPISNIWMASRRPGTCGELPLLRDFDAKLLQQTHSAFLLAEDDCINRLDRETHDEWIQTHGCWRIPTTIASDDRGSYLHMCSVIYICLRYRMRETLPCKVITVGSLLPAKASSFSNGNNHQFQGSSRGRDARLWKSPLVRREVI